MDGWSGVKDHQGTVYKFTVVPPALLKHHQCKTWERLKLKRAGEKVGVTDEHAVLYVGHVRKFLKSKDMSFVEK